MLNEFKQFALRGNALDMAVGIILGAGFGRVVSSLVSDVLMPPIGLVLGRVRFSDLFLSLEGREYPTLDQAAEAGAATLNYGVFLSHVTDFLLLAAAVFLIVRVANRLRRDQPSGPEAGPCPFCRTEISHAARRCPACTSQLEAGWAGAGSEAPAHSG